MIKQNYFIGSMYQLPTLHICSPRSEEKKTHSDRLPSEFFQTGGLKTCSYNYLQKYILKFASVHKFIKETQKKEIRKHGYVLNFVPANKHTYVSANTFLELMCTYCHRSVRCSLYRKLRFNLYFQLKKCFYFCNYSFRN